MKYTQILQFTRISLIFMMLASAGVNGYAQSFERLDIPVRKGGKLLINSSISGMVAPQFSNVDFNGDGKQDLFVFDRQGRTKLAFLWDDSGEEGRLEFAPEHTEAFPELVNFVRLVDYDRDGDKDIFTFPRTTVASSIELLRNVGSDQNPIFETVKYPDSPADVLSYRLLSGGLNPIYNAITDIPAIVDVDGDGDFDVLSFDQTSGSVVNYFRNIQVEEGLPQDSMLFQFADICWGNFFEAGFSADITLHDSQSGCATGLVGDGKGGSQQRHAGSTIEVFDNNGDGRLDCLIGDLANSGVVFLENNGTETDAWMTDKDITFPSYDSPVNIDLFLGAFYVDVDADGVRELVVAPNTNNSAWNTGHVWLYENTGTDENPIFVLDNKNFLHETSLAIPESSRPTFVDINQDGRMDLLVGCFDVMSSTEQGGTRLFYFENTGTASDPEFTFVTDDFLDVSQQVIYENLAPAFGDLDSDGDDDLLLGLQNGSMVYYENIAGPGNPMMFAQGLEDYMGIDVGKDAVPQIFDLNGDELVDLVIGENNDNTNSENGLLGGVNYFENIGTVDEAMYTELPTTNTLGGIFTKTEQVLSGASDPMFIPIESGDDFIVITGSRFGNLFLHDGVVGNLEGSFNLLTDSISICRFGFETSPALADINGDNYYEMAIGNENGGVVFYKTPFMVSNDTHTSEIASGIDLQLFPNPSNGKMRITSEVKVASYELYSMDGKLVKSSLVVDEELNLANVENGIFIIYLNTEGGRVARKVILQD